MNEGPINQGNMIETTDCLEAIGVFRGWKNVFFAIVLICLLLTQAAFWLIDRDIVKQAEGAGPAVATAPVVAANATPAAPPADVNAAATAPPADVNAAATTPPVDVNAATVAEAPDVNATPGSAPANTRFPADWLDRINVGHLARTVELVNGILLVTIALYVLAMFFSLMVSLVGRMGGMRHISRAFFLSVIVLVLAIPWQSLLDSRVPGVLYTYPELRNWLAIRDESTLNTVMHYLRFSGYWLVFVLLLLLSQIRSARWTKSILRRLEII